MRADVPSDDGPVRSLVTQGSQPLLRRGWSRQKQAQQATGRRGQAKAHKGVILGSNLVWWKTSLLMAGGLEPDDLSGPFQPKPFYEALETPRPAGLGTAREGRAYRDRTNLGGAAGHRRIEATRWGCTEPPCSLGSGSWGRPLGHGWMQRNRPVPAVREAGGGRHRRRPVRAEAATGGHG